MSRSSWFARLAADTQACAGLRAASHVTSGVSNPPEIAACSEAASEGCGEGVNGAARWKHGSVIKVHLLVDLNAHSTLCDIPDHTSSSMVHLVWHTLQATDMMTPLP